MRSFHLFGTNDTDTDNVTIFKTFCGKREIFGYLTEIMLKVNDLVVCAKRIRGKVLLDFLDRSYRMEFGKHKLMGCFKGHKVRMANSATDFSLFIGPEKEKYSYLFCMLKSGYGIDLYCSNLKKSAAVNSFVIVIISVIVIVIVKTLL